MRHSATLLFLTKSPRITRQNRSSHLRSPQCRVAGVLMCVTSHSHPQLSLFLQELRFVFHTKHSPSTVSASSRSSDSCLESLRNHSNCTQSGGGGPNLEILGGFCRFWEVLVVACSCCPFQRSSLWCVEACLLPLSVRARGLVCAKTTRLRLHALLTTHQPLRSL